MKIQLYFSIIYLFILFSCKDDAPTKPEENIDDPSATVTIGPEGGSISNGNYILKVPPGSFDSEYNLSLSIIDSSFSSDEETISPTYKISGLPAELNGQITIGIKYVGKLEGETFISFGEQLTDPYDNEVYTFYRIEKAVDSSGFLIANHPIPLSDSQNNLPKSRLSTRNGNLFDSFQKAVHKWQSGASQHFIYKYPLFLKDDMKKMVDIAETNLQILIENSIGLINKLDPHVIVIYSKKIDSPKLQQDKVIARWFPKGELVTDEFAFGLLISEDALVNSEFSSLKFKTGRELTKYSLDIAYLLKESVVLNAPLEERFLNVAFTSWAEELFTANNYEKPMNFEVNSFAPFNGLRMGAGADNYKKSFDHGVGISAVIKYLMTYELNGNKLLTASNINNIYNLIMSGNDPTGALLKTVNAIKAEWWPDFFKHYINSEIYNVPPGFFVSSANLTGIWNVNTAADTLIEFNSTDASIGKYQDLSAKMFLINQNIANIDPQKNLFVEVTGEVNGDGLSTIIFGYNNSSLEYLNQGYASESILEIPNLKQFNDSGIKQFLVVVVNSNGVPPYLGESNIYTKLRIAYENEDANQGIFSSNRCIVKVHFDGHFKQVDQNNETTEFDSEEFWGQFEAVGSFSENTFTGTYIETFGNSEYKGTIIVTLSNDQDSVVSVDWIEDYTGFSQGTAVATAHSSYGGFDIPSSELYPGVFQITSDETCDHISNVKYNSQNVTTSINVSLENHSCNQYSYITITFREE